MHKRPNDFIPMSTDTYTTYHEYDFFSSPEVLNSTDTAKSYLSDQFKIDWEKYSAIEYGWDLENGSDYSFFNNELNDDRRSTKSRSPSDFRGESLEKELRNASREKVPSRATNTSKTAAKINSKRKADDTLDLGYKEPHPKKKNSKSFEGWDPYNQQGNYPTNHQANDKVNEILGLISGKPQSSILSSDEASLESQELPDPDNFLNSIYDKEDNSDDSFHNNSTRETVDASTEKSTEKAKIKNYISTTSNGFAVMLSKHGKDSTDEIYHILKKAILTHLAAPNDEMFNWHLGNILNYAKDNIEGKTTKTTSKGNAWRQNKVSNKTEIFTVFHPQIGDDQYKLGLKKVLRDTLEAYFQSGSFLRWVDETYKTDKVSCKNFFKNKENIQEIIRVYLSQQKWRSRFI